MTVRMPSGVTGSTEDGAREASDIASSMQKSCTVLTWGSATLVSERPENGAEFGYTADLVFSMINDESWIAGYWLWFQCWTGIHVNVLSHLLNSQRLCRGRHFNNRAPPAYHSGTLLCHHSSWRAHAVWRGSKQNFRTSWEWYFVDLLSMEGIEKIVWAELKSSRSPHQALSTLSYGKFLDRRPAELVESKGGWHETVSIQSLVCHIAS